MSKALTTKTEWDFSPLMSGDDDPQVQIEMAERTAATEEFVNKWEQNIEFLSSVSVLREALDDYCNWAASGGTDGKAGYYFNLRQAVDQTNTELRGKANKLNEQGKQLYIKMQFFELRLSRISPEQQAVFLQASELEKYRHFLEKIFAQSKYVMSEEAEKVMVMKSEVSRGNWEEMLQEFLSKEVVKMGGKDVTFYQLLNKTFDTKKSVRDLAFKKFNEILLKHLPVAQHEFNSILQNKFADDQLRSVPRADMVRHLVDDIDTEVVDQMVSVVEKNFDIAKRFYKLKAKVLGLPKLAYYERNVPTGKLKTKYTWDETVEIVLKVLGELDPEFAEIARGYVENGQIDVFPRVGKRGGAFCAHGLSSHPTYILLNHTNDAGDVTTLAHECGHGINNELIKQKQHELDFGTPLSTAEVASTFMEDFVVKEIESRAKPEDRFYLLMERIQDDISTIFRQVAGYKFEQEVHQAFREKGYLSSEDIGKLFANHMASYMGDGVEQNPGSENWWVYWSHLRNNFYIYSYASGLLISKALQAKVQEDRSFISQVKQFLSAGLSASPKDIFAGIGLDITQPQFWELGVKQVEKDLEKAIELFAKIK